MTQLIVRPIDDDRYSKASQAAYIFLLKDYNYNLYKIESAKFIARYYSNAIVNAARVFMNACFALDDMFSAMAKHIGENVKRSIKQKQSR